MEKNKAKRDKVLLVEIRDLTLREAMKLLKIIGDLKGKIAPGAHGTSRVTNGKKLKGSRVHKSIEEGRE